MSCGRAFQGQGAGKQTAEGVERKEAEEGVDDSGGGRTSRTDGGRWKLAAEPFEDSAEASRGWNSGGDVSVADVT